MRTTLVLLSAAAVLAATGVAGAEPPRAQVWREPIHHVPATWVAEHLRELIDAEFSVDEPTNTLVIVANEETYLRIAALLHRGGEARRLDDPEIHVVPLRHAVAGEVARSLAFLQTSSLRIVADAATNSIVVTSSPDDYRSLLARIEQLDHPRARVLVEVTLLERDGPWPAHRGPMDDLGPPAWTRNGRVLAQRTMLLSEGETETFRAGAPRCSSKPDGGFWVSITPYVNASSETRLAIDVSEGPVGRSSRTTIVAADHQTGAFPSLTFDRVVTADSPAAALARLPIVGSLFQGTATHRERATLVFVVTPHVIRHERDLQSIWEQKAAERDRRHCSAGGAEPAQRGLLREIRDAQRRR